MNLDLDKIFGWLNSLYGAPKIVLVFWFCIAVGWVIKRLPFISNSYIPALVVVWAAIWLPLLSDYKGASPDSVRVRIITNITIGAITGFAAWIVHRFMIKPLLAKFGVKENGGTSFVTQTPKEEEKKQP